MCVRESGVSASLGLDFSFDDVPPADEDTGGIPPERLGRAELGVAPPLELSGLLRIFLLAVLPPSRASRSLNDSPSMRKRSFPGSEAWF